MPTPIPASWRVLLPVFAPYPPVGEDVLVVALEDMVVDLEVALVVDVLVAVLVAQGQGRPDGTPGIRTAVSPPISFHPRNVAWIVALIGIRLANAPPKGALATTLASWAISSWFVSPLPPRTLIAQRVLLCLLDLLLNPVANSELFAASTISLRSCLGIRTSSWKRTS